MKYNVMLVTIWLMSAASLYLSVSTIIHDSVSKPTSTAVGTGSCK